MQILGRNGECCEVLPRLFTYHLSEYLNLTRPEGSQTVSEFDENGKLGKSGDSDEVSPMK